MSYANRKQMSSNRTAAIIIVALIHIALGYALVTGLAYNVIKKAAEDLKTFDVEDEPPPPPEEPPPPPEQNDAAAAAGRRAAADRSHEHDRAADRVGARSLRRRRSRRWLDLRRRLRRRRRRRGCPRPPRPRATCRRCSPTDDYPQSAIRNEEQGTTAVRLTIGTDGRVTDCSMTASSGSSALDSATCNILRRRARFTPAKDQAGNPISDTVRHAHPLGTSGRINLELS